MVRARCLPGSCYGPTFRGGRRTRREKDRNRLPGTYAPVFSALSESSASNIASSSSDRSGLELWLREAPASTPLWSTFDRLLLSELLLRELLLSELLNPSSLIRRAIVECEAAGTT